MKMRYALPIDGCRARLSIRSNGTLNEKDYVLKISFPGLDLSREATFKLNLSYSDSFKSAFMYNTRQENLEFGSTPYFQIPKAATFLEVAVEQWQKSIEVATIETIRLNLVAPWEQFKRLTIIGDEING